MDTLLERSMPTEIDNTINETHLRRRISVWLKHIYDKKLSLDWNELIAANHCAAWSAFTVETYTIPQTDYNDYNDYDDVSEHNH